MPVQPKPWLQWASDQGDLNGLRTDGDSYMAGATITSLTDRLRTALGRVVIKTAVGGQTIDQIYSSIIDAPYLQNWITVIWDGSANGVSLSGGTYDASVASYLATISATKNWLGPRYLHIPPVSVGPSSDGSVSAYTLALEEICDGIVSLGIVTFDPIAILSPLNDASVQDVKDVSARVVPSSLLLDGTPDQVHLGDTALDAIRDEIVSVIAEQSW